MAVLVACLAPLAQAQSIRWARQFGTSGTEVAYAVASADNGIYVAGEIINGPFPGSTDSGGRDAFVAKYDAQGNQLWVRQFGSTGDDTALGIAANGTAVFVVGRTSGVLPGQTSAGHTDAFVRRYTPEGTEVWTRQFGTSAADDALAVTLVPAGLYVVGKTTGAFPEQNSASPGTDDAFIARFDDEGRQWWVRQFGTSGGDRAYSVASDAGGAYVAGYTQGTLISPSAGTDAFLRKYDDRGNVLWTRQITSAGIANDVAYGVAAIYSKVYVCGDTTGIFAGQNRIGGSDGWVQEYDPNGILQWTRQFGTVTNDTAFGIAVHNWVYIAGITGDRDAMLQRFALNGNEPAFLEFDPATSDYAFAVAVDGTGAYIAGTKNGDSLGQVSLGGGDAFLVKVPHPPRITSIGEAFTGQAGLASSTWTSIYGENLSESIHSWEEAIHGNQLPTSLNKVTVSVNGRAATVHFVSPGQVNILPPLDEATGTVQVIVSNEYETGKPYPVSKSEALPAFYAPFADARGRAVTAVALDGALLGAVGVDPRVRRAARPGEVAIFFGTGFGATAPAVPTDLIFLGSPAVIVRPRITIGGKETSIMGSGNLVGPGLYQFNLTVPDLDDGDYPVIAEVGAVKSATSVFLSVKK